MNSLSNQMMSPSQLSNRFEDLSRQDGLGFVKKRKQSLDGSECETVPFDRKDTLQERFSALSLAGKSRRNDSSKLLASQDSDSCSNYTEEEEQQVKMPKPLKFGHMMSETLQIPKIQELPNHQYKKDEFLQTLINISQNDVAGVSKYLDLDLNSKIKAIEQTAKTQDKKFSMAAITTFFNSPFCSPFANFSFNLPNDFKDEISKSYVNLGKTDKQNFASNHDDEMYIGPLTREERMKKINKYLEKKQNRNWKQVRYGVRKDLAEKRQRVQGRFVKAQPEIMEKIEMEEDVKNEDISTANNSFLSQVKIEETMDSEFARNNLSDSYSSFKKSMLSDN